jgi:cell pole-organizing protein PopZ
MNQPAKATEPSMEEILASIRRIISDDDTSKAPAAPPKPAAAAPAPRAEAPRPAPPPAPAPKPAAPARDRAAIQNDIEAVLAEPAKPAPPPPPADADILDLTEEMAAEPAAPEPEPASSNFRTIDGQPDVFFSETPEPEPEPEPEAEPESEPEPEPVRTMRHEPAAAMHGFDEPFDQSIMSRTTSMAVDSAFNHLAQSVFTQNGQTIEGLVREMLRPMLKSWLDDNLPGLVERLVRAEIERVSRGRG